jgi:predicted dehydrogenase
MSSTHELNVALIGTGFMGRTHSQAWHTAPRFFDLPLRPRAAVIVGTDPARTAAAAEKLGWESASTDWRAVVADPDVHVVDISSPGDTHAEIALAALAAGKHVMCEKPLANSLEEAETMAAAAAAAPSLVAMCGFSYRRTPALSLAKRMIDDGLLGAIRHVRAQYLQDWLSDADAPWTWRMSKERAGSGTLGDIGAHSIDTAQWLISSPIAAVSAVTRRFVDSRPVLREQVGLGGQSRPGDERLPVTVDDAVAFTASFEGGALGVFEATRMATGRKNANRIEVNGELGSIAFDFERMNELEYYDARDDAWEAGLRRIQATAPEHPYLSAWWPVGHGLGYEHTFTHEVVDFVRAIAGGEHAEPSFADALGVQRVLAAIETSAADGSRMTEVERP